MSTTQKTRFVVIDGNMLCYVHPARQGSATALVSRLSQGATHHWTDGLFPLPLDPAWVRSDDCPKPLDFAKVHDGSQAVKLDPARVRRATTADFEAFGLDWRPYAADRFCELAGV